MEPRVCIIISMMIRVNVVGYVRTFAHLAQAVGVVVLPPTWVWWIWVVVWIIISNHHHQCNICNNLLHPLLEVLHHHHTNLHNHHLRIALLHHLLSPHPWVAWCLVLHHHHQVVWELQACHHQQWTFLHHHLLPFPSLLRRDYGCGGRIWH